MDICEATISVEWIEQEMATTVLPVFESDSPASAASRRGSARRLWMLWYFGKSRIFSAALTKATRRGRPRVVVPMSRTRTRGLAASSRAK
jgi:hypothetical protein